MAANNELEKLIYRVIFEEHGSLITTANLKVILFTVMPVDAGTGGTELVGTGYTQVPVTGKFAAYTASAEVVVGGTTITTWANIANLNFGTNTSGSSWTPIVGWGIKDTVSDTLYMSDYFYNAFNQATTYTVGNTQEFIIPTSNFFITID